MSLVRFRPEHQQKVLELSFQAICECSSSGRAPPCQGGGSEFEPRHSLQFFGASCSIRCHSQVVRQSSAKAPLPSSNLGGTSRISKRYRCRRLKRLRHQCCFRDFFCLKIYRLFHRCQTADFRNRPDLNPFVPGFGAGFYAWRPF